MRNPCPWIAVAAAATVLGTPAAFAAPRAIPGLARVDVTINLENLGFECSDQQLAADGSVSWLCVDISGSVTQTVVISGTGSTRITRVAATVSDPSGSATTAARPFFGYLATLPYSGARPRQAKAWATRYTGQRRVRAFGRAVFRLGTRENARTLVITGR